jgi:hypothetical protein
MINNGDLYQINSKKVILFSQLIFSLSSLASKQFFFSFYRELSLYIVGFCFIFLHVCVCAHARGFVCLISNWSIQENANGFLELPMFIRDDKSLIIYHLLLTRPLHIKCSIYAYIISMELN